MKKVFLSTILSLLCITAFAGIKITSGNSDFLKEDAVAIVVFDYSDATWEQTATYEHWCGNDYDNRVLLGYGSFILGFNKESSKLKIKQEDSSAKYRITIKISLLEEEHGGAIWKGGLWGRFYVQCSGTIIVEEIESNKVVCTAQIEDEEGEHDLVIEDRLAKCFFALGEATAKMD